MGTERLQVLQAGIVSVEVGVPVSCGICCASWQFGVRQQIDRSLLHLAKARPRPLDFGAPPPLQQGDLLARRRVGVFQEIVDEISPFFLLAP